jgi:hypothetical protein
VNPRATGEETMNFSFLCKTRNFIITLRDFQVLRVYMPVLLSPTERDYMKTTSSDEDRGMSITNNLLLTSLAQELTS